MSEFPWNLPEEWLPELPINRALLAERYIVLKASFKTKPQNRGEIAAAVKVDISELSIFERGLLLQELLKFFGFGAEPVPASDSPNPPDLDSSRSLQKIPPFAPL